ncbi:hypothetical protein ACFL04_02435 [Patescibacteria group bacterium]
MSKESKHNGTDREKLSQGEIDDDLKQEHFADEKMSVGKAVIDREELLARYLR